MSILMIGTAAGYSKFRAAEIAMKKRINDTTTLAKSNNKSTDRVVLKNAHGTYVLPSAKEMQEEMKRQEVSNNVQSIYGKMKSGQRISGQELEYLKENSPDLYVKALKIAAEREDYQKRLKACRTKEEVERVKTTKVMSFLDESVAIGRLPIERSQKLEKMEFLGMRLMAILDEHRIFLQSKEYRKLPTEEELEKKKKAKNGQTVEKAPVIDIEMLIRELMRLREAEETKDKALSSLEKFTGSGAQASAEAGAKAQTSAEPEAGEASVAEISTQVETAQAGVLVGGNVELARTPDADSASEKAARKASAKAR